MCTIFIYYINIRCCFVIFKTFNCFFYFVSSYRSINNLINIFIVKVIINVKVSIIVVMVTDIIIKVFAVLNDSPTSNNFKWQEFGARTINWFFISIGIYETSCVLYIPEPFARRYKTHNEFHKFRLKWKFLSDSFYHMMIPKNITTSRKYCVFCENSARKSPWKVVLYATSYGSYLWRHWQRRDKLV